MKEAGVELPRTQLQDALQAFLAGHATAAERIAAVQAALESPLGRAWRGELGTWAAQLVPVEELVPDVYREWRPVVRDSMGFVVSRLSPARLAPKVVEQSALPPEMPAEERLLRLISKVPGLQKIGQVLARNRNLDPRFRRALSRLENGISDVTAEEIRAIILADLGPLVETYGVKLDRRIFSEASVSAVMRFTWRNPKTRRREQGVFKVLKPHIPSSYEEDMGILQQLAGFLTRKYARDRSRFAGLADTLTEIRLLLAHEVDLRREQRTLAAVRRTYGQLPGVRVPGLIEPLSTAGITALTYERGLKVTEALRQPGPRARLAGKLAETLLAIPAFGRQQESLFHGDPHAGNLLYDARSGDLVILDWALTESLTREQRRSVLKLTLMTMLRDPEGACEAIDRLRMHRSRGDQAQSRAVRERVTAFLARLPLWHVPGAMDALELLDEAAQAGIQFPAPMVMFRKAAFTLDGVMEDVAGKAVRMDPVLRQYALTHAWTTAMTLWTLLSVGDLVALQWSALTFCYRVLGQAPRVPTCDQAIAAEPISG